VWGFKRDYVIALVRQEAREKVTLLTLDELKSYDFKDHLGLDEVWVIRGQKIENEKLLNALNQLPWRELLRVVKVRIHIGGGQKYRTSELREVIEDNDKIRNLHALFRGAHDYSLGSEPASPSHPVVQFANVLKTENWEGYKQALNDLHRFSLTLHMRQANLNHSLLNLFKLVDSHLENLRDSNFARALWAEIESDYPGYDATLQEARELLYGPQAAPTTNTYRPARSNAFATVGCNSP
jgi:hypothetical protein